MSRKNVTLDKLNYEIKVSHRLGGYVAAHTDNIKLLIGLKIIYDFKQIRDNKFEKYIRHGADCILSDIIKLTIPLKYYRPFTRGAMRELYESTGLKFD